MNQPKASPLFKAVNKGDVAALRKLLAAGEPVDPQDHEHMTPLLRAAQSGQLELFQLLVEAGADLNAVGMGPTDALEMAASGGNTEIIRFLIGKGLPLEGQWRIPRSPELRRMGHMTPLICAAIEGKVDAVRVLLEAGADREARFDGQTALKMVKSEIKFPLYAKNDEETEQYKVIASLLETKPVKGKPSNKKDDDDVIARDVGNFARNATNPSYIKLRKMLEERCGKSWRWKPVHDHGFASNDVVGFTLHHCKLEKELNGLFDAARQAECHLVLTEPWLPGDDAKQVLFPTDNPLAVIAATGTEGSNYCVNTSDIIAWVADLLKHNSFVLRYCNHEMMGGDFTTPPKGLKQLTGKMVELCPCLLDEENETASRLAAAIKKHQSFLMRWD